MHLTNAARPESLKEYFQKGALLGQKGKIRKNCSRAFQGLPFERKKKLCLAIFFIHIIQLSLFSVEYLPIGGKKVNIDNWKGRFELSEYKI